MNSERTLLATAMLLVLLVAAEFVAAVATSGLNPDAGYYVPLARRVAAGETPFRDFPSLYPPGAYYLLAGLGSWGLAEPRAIKALVALVQLANVGLLAATLRAWRLPVWAACFFAALFGVWLLAAEGAAVVLEPFQNLFVLLAVLAVSRAPRRGAWLLGGLAFGTGLMVKQYALLSLPALWLMAWPAGSEPQTYWQAGRRFLLFVFAAATPFFAFCAATQQSPLVLAEHLASYGGEAGAYGVSRWKGLYLTLCESNGPAALLLPIAALAAATCWSAPGARSVALLLGVTANLAPLYLRDFPHYLQLAAPWALLAAGWAWHELNVRSAGNLAAPRWAALAVGVCFLPTLLQGVALRAHDVAHRPDLAQQEAAERVRALLAEQSQEMAPPSNGQLDHEPRRLPLAEASVINGEWLYVLVDVAPRAADYHFFDDAYVARQAADPPRQVIVTSGRHDWPRVDRWLQTLRHEPLDAATIELAERIPVYVRRR